MNPERWGEVEKLYNAALEREPAERMAFLDRNCHDSELRREVQSLLDHEQDGDRLLENPPWESGPSLATGTRLGPYEITSAIGAGGMGEVYRARDTRLDRAVAIKILPSHLDSDAARKRFEREARAVSTLNHPHICTLYDIGHQDGIDYLVMEYLEGETLAQKLKKGPLLLDLALRYAIEIAGAVDQAHRHGVIHRDLKPGNIMLTKSGAKVLDFGVAKVRTLDARPGLTQPTTLTEEGAIIGTLQYMAPEQLEGKEADARTDIFAFGAVVYEMATGQKAFEGESYASVTAAILERQPPPISSLNSLTPPALDHVVQTCLAKDPDARRQSAHDLMLELNWIADGSPQAGVPGARIGGLGRGRWMWIAAAAIASLIAGVFAFAYFTRKAPDAPLARFTFALPFRADAVDVAVSPDGKRIAFADSLGGSAVWVRPVDSFTAQKLPGTESAIRPFWSPDGRSLGFVSNNSGLAKVDLIGAKGSVQTITSLATWGGCAWSPEGIILYQPELTGTGLDRVPAGGGAPTPATKLNPERKEIVHRYPQFLPDGRHFIYWVWSDSEENTGIYAGSLDPREKLPEGPLVRTWREARYVQPGYLLFLQGSRLVAQRFDTTRLRLTGEPISLPELVELHWLSTGRAMFSVSPDGVLAYQEAVPPPGARIVWRDRVGKQLRSIEAPQGTLGNTFSLAPDEKRIVVTGEDDNSLEDLWVIELERATSLRLTAIHGSNQVPAWSPDGRRIAFRSNRNGVYDIYGKDASGVGEEELLVKSAHAKWPTCWSPEGRFLVYEELDPKTKGDIWVLPIEGERRPFPFLKTEFNESNPTLSQVPDSHGRLWMAYTSDETGRNEIYLRPFLPGESAGSAGAKVRVSTGGGIYPRWRRDGRELFYVVAPTRRPNDWGNLLGGKLMAVDVKLRESVEVGTPHPLFDVPPGATYWTSFADGGRFLFVELAGEPLAPKINVVLNWMAELKQ